MGKSRNSYARKVHRDADDSRATATAGNHASNPGLYLKVQTGLNSAASRRRAPDKTIAQMLYVGESTVHRTRQKCVDGGVEFALSEAPRCGGKRKLDGKAESFLVATACSEPPSGKAEWTMQMLADRLVGTAQLPGDNPIESLTQQSFRAFLKGISKSHIHQGLTALSPVKLTMPQRVGIEDKIDHSMTTAA